MSDAVIHDRGYRAYDGEVGGRSSTRKAIVVDGVRRILGLRRKARRKVVPWTLLAIAMLMSGILVGVHFAAGSVDASLAEGLPRYGELFDMFSVIAILFIAVTGPELIAPDRSQGVLSVYFSRPMTVADYLIGKAVAFLSVTSIIYLVPQIALHLGLAALSNDGFGTYLVDNLDVLWKVPAVALAFIAVHGGVLAVIVSHVDRTGFGSAAFLAVIFAGAPLVGVISEASFPGAKYFALLAFDHHARTIRDWLFDSDGGDFAPEIAGFSPWVSVAAVVVVAVVGGAWMVRRYRKLA